MKKRLLLILVSMLAAAGMTMAQDVYYAGSYMENGQITAAVFKNGALLHHNAFGSNDNYCGAVVVDEDNNDVYWVRNSNYGDVFKNDDIFLNNINSGSCINTMAFVDGDLYAGGYLTASGDIKQAAIWKNGDSTPLYILGDGTYDSEVIGICALPGGNVIACGYQVTDDGSGMYNIGMIWQNESVYLAEDYYLFCDVAFYNGEVIACGGYSTDDYGWFSFYSNVEAALYYDGELNTSSEAVILTSLYVDGGDVYYSGMMDQTTFSIWENGDEYDSFTPYSIGVTNGIGVTSEGLYYVAPGTNSDVCLIYKDGLALYEANDCYDVYDLYVTQPRCQYLEARTLPYFESFERGETDWACWEVDDEGDNGISIDNPLPYASYWHRTGELEADTYGVYEGSYCASHRYNGHFEQEGFLVSPLISLAGQSHVTLSFYSYEQYPSDCEYEGVWIASENIPNGEEIWNGTNQASSEWKLIEVDLTPYVGQEVMIAFKYAGLNGHTWAIDNVNVEGSGTTEYTINTEVNPAGAGTVEGGGTFPAGETVYLTATANTGWYFSHWNDGITTNPRSIIVNGDATYTANFLQESYTLTVNADPAEGGNVTGSGTYHYGEQVTLTATPNSGYNFISWNDGITESTRTVTVTDNATYTAIFATAGVTTYTITVVSDSPLLGSVTGGGTFPEGSVITISATPSPQAHFVKWDDDNTDNPRSITVTSNMTFKAIFEVNQNYTITVESANPTMGSATGGGTFTEGTVITISATAFGGYYFTSWDDGNAENPRNITVTQNATYKALFSQNAVTTYTLTVMCNTVQGSAIGSGTYAAGTVVTIAAIPNSGFEFDVWNDNSSENPRQVTVNDNMTFVAFFKGTGVDDNAQQLITLYPNPAKDVIRIEGLEIGSEIRIYNMNGALVKAVAADHEIGVGELASGLYLVRCGNVSLRFVKE